MRAVVQRVHSAECVVEGEIVSKIGKGLVAYIGVFDDDTEEDLLKWQTKYRAYACLSTNWASFR